MTGERLFPTCTCTSWCQDADHLQQNEASGLPPNLWDDLSENITCCLLAQTERLVNMHVSTPNQAARPAELCNAVLTLVDSAALTGSLHY